MRRRSQRQANAGMTEEEALLKALAASVTNDNVVPHHISQGTTAATGVSQQTKVQLQPPSTKAQSRIAVGKVKVMTSNTSLLDRWVQTDYGENGVFCGRIVRADFAHRGQTGHLKPYFVHYEDGEEQWEDVQGDRDIVLLPSDFVGASCDDRANKTANEDVCTVMQIWENF